MEWSIFSTTSNVLMDDLRLRVDEVRRVGTLRTVSAYFESS